MMSFLRRFSKSPIGIAVFGLILVAFVVTLYEGKAGLDGAAGNGGAIATVGGVAIPEAEMARRAQNAFDAVRRDDPQLDMAQFVASGGVERAVELTVNGRALELFARQQGMVASKKLVDGEIASIPAFLGPTGKFDRSVFLGLLAQRKLGEAQLRDDLGREALTRALIVPAAGAARVPAKLVEPYAALLLEARSGQIATIPSVAFLDATPPSEAELTAYYTRSRARYTVPERRVVRYATFDIARFKAQSVPSTAEIERVYATRASVYGGSERRSFTQVIVPTKAEADDIATRVRGGLALADAAKAVKRDALAVPQTARAAFATLTSDAVATAAFAANRGEIAAIARSGLGFHVVRVDAVTAVAPTALAAVRTAIATELSAQKEARALADFVAQIDDAVTANATFDEVAKKFELTPTTAPALTNQGKASDAPGYVLPEAVRVTLAEAFKAEVDDDPAVAALGSNNGYAFWKLDRILPAAPQPLSAIRARAIADLRLDKGSKAAKSAADRTVAAINAGTPVPQALVAIGRQLPPVSVVSATRLEVARAEKVPPPLALLFALPAKRARVLELPGKQGWYVVYLAAITRGNVTQAPGLIEATQQQLSRVVGSEYVDQFARAARAAVGAKIDTAAVARLKRNLSGGAAQQ